MHTSDSSPAADGRESTERQASASATPALAWRDGQPFSTQFGDVYFSTTDGLAETQHVFLQHNQLPARWRQLGAQQRFTVGETGFGTGLNFLAAAQLWLATAPTSATLHYLSVEKHPLGKADLQRALALWPALATLAEPLCQAYPDHLESEIYSLQLAGGRIHLTLIIGDAKLALDHQIHQQHPDFVRAKCRVDAWFLDGFAPAKNPDMWRPDVFARLAALSYPGTTLATFTSAGDVRRGLQAAGFTVGKVPGFGKKREMLAGTYTGPVDAAQVITPDRRACAPWQLSRCQPAGRRALVIGAGIAGCHTARALADRGWQVAVLEAHPQPAAAASGNAQGVVYAKLSPKRHPQGRFNLVALSYALQFYRQFWQEQPAHGAACGVLQLTTEKDSPAHQAAASAGLPITLAQPVDQSTASELAGLPLPSGGLHLPRAGWLNPPALCQWLLNHPNIHCHYNHAVNGLASLDDGRWRADSPNGQFEADLLVVACAHQAKDFSQLQHLPLKRIRGQVTQLPSRAPLTALRCVITREGYVAPAYRGQHSVGATFTLKDNCPAVSDRDHVENLQQLRHLLPAMALPPTDALHGKVGFRCTTPDYLPIVGPVANAPATTDIYAPLARNARAAVPSAPSYWPNLLVNVAHGSRGLAYTPLCAQYLAALADNSPVPLHQDLARALHPARFLIRDIARGKR